MSKLGVAPDEDDSDDDQKNCCTGRKADKSVNSGDFLHCFDEAGIAGVLLMDVQIYSIFIH